MLFTESETPPLELELELELGPLCSESNESDEISKSLLDKSWENSSLLERGGGGSSPETLSDALFELLGLASYVASYVASRSDLPLLLFRPLFLVGELFVCMCVCVCVCVCACERVYVCMYACR